MFTASPALRHMVRLDGRTTRCGMRPPKRADSVDPATLAWCPECVPGSLPLDARKAHAKEPAPAVERFPTESRKLRLV